MMGPMDAEECKYRVLELVCSSNKARYRMCELRISLFMASANSHRSTDSLMPFPSCFFDPVTKTKRFADLQKLIADIPRLAELKLETDLPELTWKLLYWIFTNPLTIDPVLENVREALADLKKETGLTCALPANNNTFLFTVRHPYPKKLFVQGKAAHGTFYAFHGSSLDNFHSIIHRGLVAALSKRAAYGPGSYLSSSFAVSNHYSGTLTHAWSKGLFGTKMKCVAICEVVNDPRIKKVNVGEAASGVASESSTFYYIVQQDELIQMSHLLVFGSVDRLIKRQELGN